MADLSDGAVHRPVVESSLWPTRLVSPLAVFRIFVVGFFFFTMTGVHSLNYNSVLSFQFAGATDNELHQTHCDLTACLAPSSRLPE